MTIYKAGDLIEEAKPFVLVIFEKNKAKYCDYCFLPLKEPKRCAGCRTMYYCGQACAKADWKTAHKFKECQALKANSLLSSVETILEIDEGQSEYLLKLVTTCKLFLRLMLKKKLDPNYSSVFTMADGTKMTYEDMPEHRGSMPVLSAPVTLALRNTVKDLLATHGLPVSDDEMWQLSAKYFGNYVQVSPSVAARTVGFGIYVYRKPVHSCCSNSEMVSYGRRMTIKASRDIDTELEPPTVCYVDPEYIRAKRQEILFYKYDITCECSRCETGTEYPEDLDIDSMLTSMQPSIVVQRLRSNCDETRRVNGGQSLVLLRKLQNATFSLLRKGHQCEALDIRNDLIASLNIFHGPDDWIQFAKSYSAYARYLHGTPVHQGK